MLQVFFLVLVIASVTNGHLSAFGSETQESLFGGQFYGVLTEARKSCPESKSETSSSFQVNAINRPRASRSCKCRDKKKHVFKRPADTAKLLPLYDIDIAVVANSLISFDIGIDFSNNSAPTDTSTYDYLVYMLKYRADELLQNDLFQKFLHDYRTQCAIAHLECCLAREYGVYECDISDAFGIFNEIEKELPGVIAQLQRQPIDFFAGWQYPRWDYRGNFTQGKNSVFTYDDLPSGDGCTCNFQHSGDRTKFTFIPEKATEVRSADLKVVRDILIELPRIEYTNNAAISYLAHMFVHHRKELLAHPTFKALVQDYRIILYLLFIKKGLLRHGGHWMHTSPKRLIAFEDVDKKAPGFLEAVKELPFTFPMSFEVPNATNK